jgi:hypothetical protein
MLKSRDSLLKPDPRNDAMVVDQATGDWRPIRIEDLHELVACLELNPSVPTAIREQFDSARNTFVQSWFTYELATVAEQQGYTAVEMALRNRIDDAGGNSSNAHGMGPLYQTAVSLKCFRREDFEVASLFNHAERLSQFEIIRLLRNRLAHGQTHLLPDGSLQMLRLCHEILDKLYPPATAELA